MSSKEGRPLLLTEDRIQEICRLAEVTPHPDPIAARLGIHAATLRRWLRRGRREAKRLGTQPNADPNAEESIYLQLYVAWARVTGECEARALGVIHKAMLTDWKAATWFLERLHPDRWTDQHREVKSMMRRLNEALKQHGH